MNGHGQCIGIVGILSHYAAMSIGHPVDESGTLLRKGGGFVLQRDAGGQWRLDLHRMPVDLVGKRVRLVGVRTGEDLVEVEGVRPG
jgi:hypothetical protein